MLHALHGDGRLVVLVVTTLAFYYYDYDTYGKGDDTSLSSVPKKLFKKY